MYLYKNYRNRKHAIIPAVDEGKELLLYIHFRKTNDIFALVRPNNTSSVHPLNLNTNRGLYEDIDHVFSAVTQTPNFISRHVFWKDVFRVLAQTLRCGKYYCVLSLP